MDWELPRPVILKYYLYQASVSFGFFTAIFTLFLRYRGLTFTEIAMLNTIYAVVTVVAEVPTGYIGDRIGRRNSLLASSTLMTTSIVGYAVAESFPALTVLYVLWGFALAFRSGSGEAWLYDTLKVEIGEEHFARIQGRAQSVNSAVTVVTILVGSVLYSVQPELPFLASGVLNGAGILVLLSLPQNEQYADPENSDDTFTIVKALPVIRENLTQPPLRSFVLYIAFFFGAILAMDTYIQPIAVSGFGVPASMMGPLYAGFTGFTAVTSYYSGAIKDRLGVRGATLLIPALLGVSLVAPVVVPILAFPMFFVAKGSYKLMYPIANQYINDHTGSVGRATILSVASMVYSVVKLPFYLLSGVVADAFTPILAVGALGGVFLVCIVVIYAWEVPVGATSGAASQTAD